jgi:signal peptide peptidase SppA
VEQLNAISLDSFQAKALEHFLNGKSEYFEIVKGMFSGKIEAKELETRAASNISNTKTQKKIGVLNISGAIDYKAGFFGKLFGVADVAEISKSLNEFARNKEIAQIILNIDSPGGGVFGVNELSQKIRALSTQKTIVSFANPMALSAGYWISSAASESYALPSAYVGSVGAFTRHVDYSGMLEQDGVKVTYIFAGENKVLGNNTEPLSEDAKAIIQARIDRVYGEFVSAVAAGRNKDEEYVKENFGKGDAVDAKTGLRVGMIDGIYTEEELLQFKIEQVSRESSKLDFMTKARNYLTTSTEKR